MKKLVSKEILTYLTLALIALTFIFIPNAQAQTTNDEVSALYQA